MKTFTMDMNELSTEELFLVTKLISSGKIKVIERLKFEKCNVELITKSTTEHKIKRKPIKGAQWTKEELKTALKMRKNGVSTAGIAEEIGRSAKAVRNMISRLETKSRLTKEMAELVEEDY